MALVRAVGGDAPVLGEGVFLADNATVVGAVTLGAEANVWYGAVLRADVGYIRIGARTNVQDLACCHMSQGISNTEIGADVTVGHGAIIHGARVGDGALIGMGSVLLDNCEVGSEAIVAAGSVVPPGMVIPPRTMARGAPAKVVRELTEKEWRQGRDGARHYVELARGHR